MKPSFLSPQLQRACVVGLTTLALSTSALAKPNHAKPDHARASKGAGDRDWALNGADAQDQGGAGALNQAGAGAQGGADAQGGAGAQGGTGALNQPGAGALNQAGVSAQVGTGTQATVRALDLPAVQKLSAPRQVAAIPAVPEANAGLVLIPFVGAVLFFSTRRLWVTKAAQPADDQRA
jgi:hypothetical protein